jgi:dsDNA-specific endonuclease/ATPase MutS2
LIEELESARKRAMDDDARVREEVSALKAALRRSESSLNEEVTKVGEQGL